MTQATRKKYNKVVNLDATEELIVAEREATKLAAAWGERAKQLRAAIEAVMGDADAGTVRGRVVVTHLPKEQWAVARLRSEYPDLTAQFVEIVAKEEFVLDKFRVAYPDIARQYQVKSFGSTYEVR